MKTQTEELLKARIEREQSEQRLPSVVGGLVRDGILVWSGGAGQVAGGVPDADVQYRCGSITKTFVAVQIMRLRDEGLLKLTDPLELHLPGAFDGVTIAQLLSHSSGLRAETAGPWWERTAGGDFQDLVARSLNGPSDSATTSGPDPARQARPGRRFHYSNVGFAILGELVSRKRGAPWTETVETELLIPLGMTRTTMRPTAPHASGFAVHPYADLLLSEPEHDAGAMAPAGQLWTTVADLARWMAFLAGNPTPGAEQPVLAVATLEEMREPQAVDNRRGEAWSGAHGLGLQVWNSGGERAFGHGGSMPGFLAIMAIDADSGDGSIIMANSTSGLRPALGDDLESILKEHEPRPVTPWIPQPPAPDLLDALGRWFWGPSAYTLRATGATELVLEAQPPGGRSSRFRMRPDGSWVGLDAYFTGETLRFVHADGSRNNRPDGDPLALDIASFIFTRTPYDPDAPVPGGVDPAGWR